MTDKTSDPFDSADYYTPYGDAESFTAETVEEAIREYEDEGGIVENGVTLYAHKRRAVPENWAEGEAEHLAESLSDDYEDEFGGGDSRMIDGVYMEHLEKELRLIVRQLIKDCPTWQCEPVSKRIYSPEEAAEILEGKS
jgi:hypothetical protein